MAKPSVNPKLFTGQNIKTLKHDEYLLLLNQRNKPLKEIIIPLMREQFDSFKKNNMNLNKKIGNLYDFHITWTPEYPIKAGYSYIGSIDLLVILKCKSKVTDFRNETYNIDCIFRYLFEFKPNITSFSEVIRQIKVYEQYLFDAKSAASDRYYFDKSICLTESNIDLYKEIFNSQNIAILNISQIQALNQESPDNIQKQGEAPSLDNGNN